MIYKETAKFRVTHSYGNTGIQPKSVNVMLEIDYVNNVFHITPYTHNNQAFIFKIGRTVGSTEKWLAVCKCIEQAAEFADTELKKSKHLIVSNS